jgi:hypothetical protein
MQANFERTANDKTWKLRVDLRGNFTSMEAITLSRQLKDRYNVNASIKKAGIKEGSPLDNYHPVFIVLVKFQSDEEEAEFMLRSVAGLEV